VLPAFVSDLFGPKISAATHGVTISVWALATVVCVPIFTSVTASHYVMVGSTKVPTPEAYMINSYWLCGLPAIGFLVLLFLNVATRDRKLREEHGGARVRIFKWVIAMHTLSPQAQDEEWARFEEHRAVVRAGIKLPPATPLDMTPAAAGAGAATPPPALLLPTSAARRPSSSASAASSSDKEAKLSAATPAAAVV
jgi:hypothetical protein